MIVRSIRIDLLEDCYKDDHNAFYIVSIYEVA